MFNLNYDILNVEQLLLEKQSAQIANEVQKSEVNNNEEKTLDKESEAVELKLSQVVLGKLNDALSLEDGLNQDLNTARTIYDSLSNIRIELAGLLKDLQNTDSVEQTLENLEKIDEKSNALIERAISVVKQNDTKGLVDSSFMNTIFDGLNGLKSLNLADNDYFAKIDGIMSNVKTQQNAYDKVSETLYSKLAQISTEYEKMVNDKTNNEKIDSQNSADIQKKVITNVDTTLLAVASRLTPETVMRLLNP